MLTSHLCLSKCHFPVNTPTTTRKRELIAGQSLRPMPDTFQSGRHARFNPIRCQESDQSLFYRSTNTHVCRSSSWTFDDKQVNSLSWSVLMIEQLSKCLKNNRSSLSFNIFSPSDRLETISRLSFVGVRQSSRSCDDRNFDWKSSNNSPTRARRDSHYNKGGSRLANMSITSKSKTRSNYKWSSVAWERTASN